MKSSEAIAYNFVEGVFIVAVFKREGCTAA